MVLTMTRFSQHKLVRKEKISGKVEYLKERCWPAGPGFGFFLGYAFDVDDVGAGLCEDVV